MKIVHSVRCLALRVSLFLLILIYPVSGQVCSHPKEWNFYSHGDYQVREVRIESPLDFFQAVSKSLDEIKASLPLQPDSIFSATKASAGRALINDQLKADDKYLDQSLRVIVVIGRVENCKEDASPHQLDLVYRVFTSNYNSYLSHLFESRQLEIERPATTAATSSETSSAKSSLLVKPNVSYNRTRGLFGGMNVVAQMPGGIFDSLSFSASGSTTSNEEELELSGTREPQGSIFSRFEYSLGYRHSDIPAGTNRLREGRLQAQFFAATQPLGAREVVGRFGVSLEGGNQQTELQPAIVAGNNLTSSGYGSLKAYAGATASGKRYSLTASYGLQLGTEGASASVAFAKHIVDMGATAQFWLKEDAPGAVHKPVNIEAQATGGIINRSGLLPVAERFFGGNASSDFISNDTWKIRADPFIRSIPQNRLNSAATLGPIGGSSFFSINLTVSKPIWGRPIIPREMAADPDFFPAVDAAKNTARETLITTYKNNVEGFQAFINNLQPVRADAEHLQSIINSLPSNIDEDSDLGGAIEDARDDIAIINNFFRLDKSDMPSRLDNFIKVNTSVMSMLVEHLGALGDELDTSGLPAPAQQVKELKQSVANKQSTLLAQLNSIDFSEAVRQADEVMNSINPVLDTFIKELNIYSISPVAVFDAARIWPDRFGTRYGIGGGVRLSLVNFNVTLGYAVNPHPRFQEGRGAFFFSMDVTDLFR